MRVPNLSPSGLRLPTILSKLLDEIQNVSVLFFTETKKIGLCPEDVNSYKVVGLNSGSLSCLFLRMGGTFRFFRLST